MLSIQSEGSDQMIWMNVMIEKGKQKSQFLRRSALTYSSKIYFCLISDVVAFSFKTKCLSFTYKEVSAITCISILHFESRISCAMSGIMDLYY